MYVSILQNKIDTFYSTFQVLTVSMWSLRLIVLVRSDYKNKISHLQHSTVKTGIANKLGMYQW